MQSIQLLLSFCNFYQQFIRNYSHIAKWLNHLIWSTVVFVWDDACQTAFEKLKRWLSEASVLRHYQSDLKIKLETDASDGVMMGVLSQQHKDEWHPVAYYSKSMSDAERNYEIHDKEMLAIVQALQKWHTELEELQLWECFNIYTDHQSLEYFMTIKKLNDHQAWWAEFLSQFYFLIQYHSDKQNTLADALSQSH